MGVEEAQLSVDSQKLKKSWDIREVEKKMVAINCKNKRNFPIGSRNPDIRNQNQVINQGPRGQWTRKRIKVMEKKREKI